jgi:Fe-S cluster assembly protein SufD
MNALRAKAAVEFREAGVPHRRVEAWKYSDLRALVDAETVASAPDAQWSIESEGVEIADLANESLPDLPEGIMGAASRAFAKAGFVLRVRKSGSAKVTFTAAGQARVLIALDPGATLTYTEIAASDGFENIGTDILVGENAHLVHARLAPEGKGARIADVSVAVARGGSYRLHCADLGAELSRLDLRVALDGEGAQAHLSGVGMVKDAHADITTHIEHRKGNTQSTQLFKYVAGGKARGVYQGKVTVQEGADGSDSRQTAKGLLLDGRAEIDLKPELEIFADDVKCAHGAAVGDLDADSLFYLRSRGVPEDEARSLLIRAFLEEAFDGIADAAMRALLQGAVEAKL